MARKPKSGPDKGTEVYCVVARCNTSKGPMVHGDRKTLPADEAQALKDKGEVQ